jgi:pimeloyl-ACP methyl ester carboxylesterase
MKGTVRIRGLCTCMSILLQVACSAPVERSDEPSPVDTALAQLGDAFVSRTANVNGTTVHYVRGGSGPAMILLHGFPQDWSVFRQIMPRLARTFTVLAVDLRGIGGSTPAPDGVNAATLAEDIYQLARHLVLERPYVAGHDNGGMVAHALARLHPEATRGVMILDVPIPGLVRARPIRERPAMRLLRNSRHTEALARGYRS